MVEWQNGRPFLCRPICLPGSPHPRTQTYTHLFSVPYSTSSQSFSQWRRDGVAAPGAELPPHPSDVGPLNTAGFAWSALKIPERVQAELGRQTFSGALFRQIF